MSMAASPATDHGAGRRDGAPRTRFIGRDRELTYLSDCLRHSALITVIGPPGVGKTRLVRQFTRSGPGKPKAIWWCDLSRVERAEGLPEAAAAALQIEGEATAGALEMALASPGPAILVLDGFDGLAQSPEALEQLDGWLEACPSLRVLSTSRIRLGLRGERCLELAGLPQDQAIELFVDRCRATNWTFELEPDHQEIAARIVDRLDRLPLALELSAADADLLPLPELAARLERGLSVLSERAPLDRAIAMSWARLSPPDREALGACAVFEGAFSTRAAEAVIAPGGDAFAQVSALRDASMLYTETPEGQPRLRRLRLYQSIRAHALRRSEPLAQAAARDRHALFCSHEVARLAERTRGPHARSAVQALRLDLPDALAAARRAIQTDDLPLAVDVLGALASVAPLRAQLLPHAALWAEAISEIEPASPDLAEMRARTLLGRVQVTLASGPQVIARSWLEEALVLAGWAGQPDLRGEIAVELGRLQHDLGSFNASEATLGPALDDARSRGDRAAEGLALESMARGALFRQVFAQAAERAQAALEIHRERGDGYRAARSLWLLAQARGALGLREEEARLLAQARDLCRELDDRRGEAQALLYLGVSLLNRGDAGAAEALRGALRRCRQAGAASLAGEALLHLGLANLADDRMKPAEAALLQVLEDRRSPRRTAQAMLCLGLAAWAQGDLQRAAARLERALEIARSIGDVYSEARAGLIRALILQAMGRNASLLLDRSREMLRGRQDPESAAILAVVDRGDLDAAERAGSCMIRLVCKAARTQNAARRGLEVERTGRWFQIAGDEPIELSSRRHLRAILLGLIAARLETPGQPLPLDAVLELGWPGERMLPSAARNRVYAAVRGLRRMGLDELLLTREGGYLLDPDRAVRWSS